MSTKTGKRSHIFMFGVFLALMTLSLVILGGCRSNEAVTSTSYEEAAVPMAPSAGAGPGLARMEASSRSRADNSAADSVMPAESKALSPEPQTAGPVLKPQLIKEATVSMRVDKIVAASKRLKVLVKRLGGYVTMENMSLSEEESSYRSASMTIRLPQVHLDPFLDAAGNVGKILNEQISSTDVSRELVDTESRIRNLQAEEKALQHIMTRAGKIPEVLQVSQELARVRGQIEQAQGSLNFMKGQVAYSTVNLTMSEKTVTASVNTQPGIGEVLSNTVQEAWSALYGFILTLLSVSIWLIFFLPVIGLVLYAIMRVVGWLLKRSYRAWREQKKTENPPAPPPGD